jgi:tetratricopeptide (TPR) repeat protein
VLLAVATLLLLAYNIWLIKARRRFEWVYTQRRQRLAQFSRWAVHIASVLLLTLSWSVVGILASDRWAGHLFFGLGQFERATVRLSSYVATTEDDISAHKKLAESYKELGDYNAYFRTLEDLLANKKAFEELDPDKQTHELGIIHFSLGSALLVDEYTEGLPSMSNRALHHLKNARLFGGDNPGLLMLLGYAEANIEDDLPNATAKVKKTFEQIKSLVNSFEDAQVRSEAIQLYHYWYGKALGKLKLYDEAEEELNSALDLTTAADGRGATDSDKILLELGRNEYNRTDDVSKANEYWQRITKAEFLRDALRLNGLNLWHQGVKASNKGEHDEAAKLNDRAEELLVMAVRMGDRSPNLHLQLGAMYFSREDYRQAAETFRKLTKMWPSNNIGYYWLGRSKFLVEGGLEEADTAMSRAVELEPKDGAAHYWLGRIALARDQLDRSLAELVKSLELGSSRDDVHMHLVHTLLSLAVKAEEYSDEYLSLLERSLKRTKEGIEAAEVHKKASVATALGELKKEILNYLAYTYAQRKENLSLALSYIDGALEENPDSPYYLDTKAWILILIAERSTDVSSVESDLRNAEKLLKRALDLLPEEEKKAKAETLFHLGYIQKLRGDQERARKLFMEALDLDPAYLGAKAELE